MTVAMMLTVSTDHLFLLLLLKLLWCCKLIKQASIERLPVTADCLHTIVQGPCTGSVLLHPLCIKIDRHLCVFCRSAGAAHPSEAEVGLSRSTDCSATATELSAPDKQVPGGVRVLVAMPCRRFGL